MTTSDYDILIVGGGMVGMSMACALGNQPLGNQPLKIGIIEAHLPHAIDTRCTALAYGSWTILKHMGLWDNIDSTTTPIYQVHVSDRGQFGSTRIDHQQEGVEALGYVVENQVINQALQNKLSQYNNVTLIGPARVNRIQRNADQVVITTHQPDAQLTYRAKLIIAADGGNSMIRTKLQIPTETKDYQQTAVISTVTPRYPHQHIAYERFTDNGPIALLPLANQRYSLVLTCPNDTVESVKNLDDQPFLNHLTSRFGYRTGGFIDTTPRVAYPLTFIRAKQPMGHRLVLIGNAAHTLHPIAGQGFNLGIRDVAALAQVIVNANRQDQDIGSQQVLENYQRWRKQDHCTVSHFTDTLARLFITRSAVFTCARSMGLMAANFLPPLKHNLTRHAMGLSKPWPKLTLGLPL